jgi:hypothetical protein
MWGKYFFEAAEKFGTPADVPAKLKTMMEEAGFVDIEEHIIKLPLGTWPKNKRLKNVGVFEMVNMQEGIEGLSMMAFTRALKWTPEAVQLFLMEVRTHVRERKSHCYYHL